MARAARTLSQPTEGVIQLGEAMQRLPCDAWRRFVYEYVTGKPGHGAATAAIRRAGMASNAKPDSVRKIAWQLTHDPRVLQAIGEESRKYLRVGAPAAVHAINKMVLNPAHKDHARACEMVLARVDPIETRHLIDVTHRHRTLDDEALDALKTMRELNASREQLIAFFGEAGLRRYEAMLSETAEVIEGEIVEETAA
jgi:phage terminase small subunit